MFILIEVIERDIFVTKFKTHEEAYNEMTRRLKEIINLHYDDDEFGEQNDRGSEWDYGYDMAWSNINDNFDWKIEEI
jgi:hypothetical protein